MHLGAIMQAAQQAATTGKTVVINGSIEDFIDQLAQEAECDGDCEDCPLNHGLDGAVRELIPEKKSIGFAGRLEVDDTTIMVTGRVPKEGEPSATLSTTVRGGEQIYRLLRTLWAMTPDLSFLLD